MTEGMIGIFKEIITLFVIVGVGYAAKRLRFMNDEFDRMLSKLVINIALPGMILGSVLTATELPTQAEVWLCLGLSVASTFVMFAVAYGFTLLLRIPDGRRGVYRFMLCFGNVGFIGYPVLSAIFGPDALVYAAVFNLPFNFFVFTVGAWFLTQDIDGDVKVQTSWRTFVTPVMLSCVAAVVLTLAGIHHAPILGEALNTLGSITTPAALLIIAPYARRISSDIKHLSGDMALIAGGDLSHEVKLKGNLPVRDLIGGPRLWTCSVFRLIVMPAIIWAVFHAFVPAGLMFSVAVVLAGMPVATNGTMLCYQYGGNSRVMAQGTFVTTVLAIASIPILAGFVGVVM